MTLALAHALQACAERSEMLTGILCDSAQELQKCMAPLMILSKDDIVKASLLKPTEEECETYPPPEEEAILLGKEVKLPEVPSSLPECMEIPKLAEPAEQTNAPSTALPPSPVLQPSCHPSKKERKPWGEIGADPNCMGEWEWKSARMVGGVLISSLL